ncbi:MAG: hypothetical protein FWG88_11860 [Oscillospiraceae bacterium]|nr:hypothetical protein [Oscillospiraceae bacterium]
MLAGVIAAKADAIVNRFPSYFVYALHNEWKRNPEVYKKLLNETPFSPAVVAEDDWERYRAYLDKQIQESVFQEAFSLEQIYVPLCGYYEVHKEVLEEKQEKNSNSEDKMHGYQNSGIKKIEHHVIELDTWVRTWLKDDDKTEQILLILDGLDELTQQGNAGSDAADAFITQIYQMTQNYNSYAMRIRVLITGRDVTIKPIEEKYFKKEGRVVHVLPYYVSGNEAEPYTSPFEPEFIYIDPNNLLREDRRIQWWERCARLTGKTYKGVPEELKQKRFDEITVQPLLNYLLALSYDREKIRFSEDTYLNELYEDLFDSVFEREWQ